MAATVLEHPPPAGVVADAHALIDALHDLPWSGCTPGDLIATVEAIESLRGVLTAVEAGLLCEIDAQGVAKDQLGWGSTADWYSHVAGVRPGAGKRAVEHARALLDDRSAVREALRGGLVSDVQAGVILDAIELLPTSPRLRREGEAHLIGQAARLSVHDLQAAGRTLAATLDPDRSERDAEAARERQDRAAHVGRGLSITPDGAGGVRVRGRGTAEDAATLRAALLPLARPVPVAVADDGTAAGRDPRDHKARMWDALIGLAEHALTTDLVPDSHGAPTRVSVTIDLDALTGRVPGIGVTEDGIDLSAPVVRRLACDADVIPVCLGSRSEPLDVGRTVRLVTGALWRALVCRDRHCAFPGCTRPPVMTHAHHITHWADGGETNLANTVLLCGHHHRTLHQSAWEVRLNPEDHHPEFLPPPRPGRPPPDWTRHRPRRE